MKSMKILKVILIGLFVLLLLIFASEHMYDVNITLFVYTFKVPLFVLLLIFGFVGFIIPTIIFSAREHGLRKKISNIFDISKSAFFIRYYQKPKINLEKIQYIPPLYYIFANIFKASLDYKEDTFGLFEKAKSLRYHSKEEAINILDSIKEEPYPALCLKRDILFDNKEFNDSNDIQQSILKITPKSEKQFQKDISNTIKSILTIDMQDNKQRLKILEDIFDDTQNELTAFMYISELLIQEKTKDAVKIMQNTVQGNLKDKIILVGCSFPQRAVYFLNTEIENMAAEDILGIFFIHIGAPQKVKLLENTNTGNETIDFLLKSYQNPTLKDAYDILFKNLKLWKCRECNTYHKIYSPKCSCDAWFSLDINIHL